MSEIEMVRRTVTVVSPSDDLWSWSEVVRRAKECPLWLRPRLWFSPWRTVIAPRGVPCEVTTLANEPIYRYKDYRGRAYLVSPEPSPSFPGS